ncbi:hypothetical protein LTS17_003500 [Exophiala oligosperma]
MRAQVLEAFNEPYRLRNIPPPASPAGQDLLIRVLAASYCHTDAVLATGSRWPELPRVGSHELAGEIVEMGPEVSSSLKLKIGTKIGVPARAYRPCGHCYECQNTDGDIQGFSVYCPKAKHVGLSINGGFADYCLVDSRQVVVVPEGLMAVEVAPLMCAGFTIWCALERAGIALEENEGVGRSVAIMGAGGGLGHLGVQFAAKLGCHVAAVEAADKPLALLRNIVGRLDSPTQDRVTVVDARTQSAEEVRNQVCGEPKEGFEGESGIDAVLILSDSQSAFDFGMKLLKNHSTCVVISFPKAGFCINAQDLIFRDIKIIGSLVGRIRQLQEMMSFVVRHDIRAQIRVHPLEKVNELVKDYHSGTGGKLVVDLSLSEG